MNIVSFLIFIFTVFLSAWSCLLTSRDLPYDLYMPLSLLTEVFFILFFFYEFFVLKTKEENCQGICFRIGNNTKKKTSNTTNAPLLYYFHFVIFNVWSSSLFTSYDYEICKEAVMSSFDSIRISITFTCKWKPNMWISFQHMQASRWHLAANIEPHTLHFSVWPNLALIL